MRSKKTIHVVSCHAEGEVGDVIVGGVAAIVPWITRRAWIATTHQHMLDPVDPWPPGYRVGHTWPMGDC